MGEYEGSREGSGGEEEGFRGEDEGFRGEDEGFRGEDEGFRRQDEGSRGEEEGSRGEDMESEEEEVEPNPPKKRRKSKPQTKMDEKNKLEALREAKAVVQSKQMSEREAARVFGVPRSTLKTFISAPEDKPFMGKRGRKREKLDSEEAAMIEKYCDDRSKLGCGYNFKQLQSLFKEFFTRVCENSPNRRSGFETSNHLPPISWVYEFVRRGNLVLRSTLELGSARALLSVDTVVTWFDNVDECILTKPGLQEANMDPRRKFSTVRILMG